MSLTAKQRKRLKEHLKPYVTDAVREAASESLSGGTGEESFADKILASRDPGPRAAGTQAGRTFARLGMIQAAADHDRQAARDLARTLDVEDAYRKAQSAGSATAGGLLISDDQASQVIELLRPRTAVRRIGPRQVSIPRGTLQTPRIDTGVTSGYVGEGQAIPATSLDRSGRAAPR